MTAPQAGRRRLTGYWIPATGYYFPMANDKRERQRANRALRQAEEAAQLRKEKLKKRGRQVAMWAVIIVALFLTANAVWGGA